MTLVELAFDDGPSAGLGHRRRMEALGAALVRRGVEVRHRPVDAPAEAPPADVTVVDSYRVRADDGTFAGRRVVAVDDLDRGLAVDLLVRPSPGSVGGSASRAGRSLQGFEYALVEVRGAAPRRGDRDRPAVLVTLGGADRAGHGARIASAIARRLPLTEVRHAPGPWSVRSSDPSVRTVDPSCGLDGELVGAAVVVTAGGVTMLESLCHGRPTVVVVTAENQGSQAQEVDRAGAAVVVSSPRDAEAVASAVQALIEDPDQRAALSERASRLVDGRGAERVAEAIVALL